MGAVRFFSVPMCFLLFHSLIYSCLSLDKFHAPLIDRHDAPLVAVLDTSKISVQIVDSLKEPISLMVNETVEGYIDAIVDKKLSDFMNKYENDNEKSRKTINSLEKEIGDLKTVVAMTSCSNVREVKKGGIIHFKDRVTAYGITNNMQDAFSRTGIFTCETPGLYLVTVSIMSKTTNACFDINKDEKMLRSVQVTPHSSADNNYHTGTGSVVVMLNQNETVFVKTIQKTLIHYEFGYSCISITKIK